MKVNTRNMFFIINKETNTILAVTQNKTQAEVIKATLSVNYEVYSYRQKIITSIK